jgi:hypothetical protein
MYRDETVGQSWSATFAYGRVGHSRNWRLLGNSLMLNDASCGPDCGRTLWEYNTREINFVAIIYNSVVTGCLQRTDEVNVRTLVYP